MTKTFEGVLFPFAETGTEGVLWALQENYTRDYWDYKDLYILADGDHMTIFGPDKEEVWSDKIELKPNPNYTKDNIHLMPLNFDRSEWIRIFCAGETKAGYAKGYTAQVVRQE